MRGIFSRTRACRHPGRVRCLGCWRRTAGLLGILFAGAAPVAADPVATDVTGTVITLAQPARRIVSLAPHVTEMLYAAGAGDAVVAAVEFSDYPPPARRLVRVGSAAGLDLEAIVALRPDLVVGWQSGNPAPAIARLKSLGLAVFLTEPRRIEDVPLTIEHLGRLAGTEARAEQQATAFRQRHATLRKRFFRRQPVSVFYQILDPVLLTVNGQHLISDAIRLCSGRNVFADLPPLVAQVNVESVLAANPEVIVASGEAAVWESWRARWRQWPQISAVRADRLYFLAPDAVHRPGPRILDGAAELCALLAGAPKR